MPPSSYPESDRLKTDAFLRAFFDEAEEAMRAMSEIAAGLEAGLSAAQGLARGAAVLDALAGAGSFAGRGDVETLAAKGARELIRLRDEGQADAAAAAGCVRRIHGGLRALLAQASCALGRSLQEPDTEAAALAIAAWTTEQHQQLAAMVTALFADCAFSLGRDDLSVWPRWLDQACGVPARALWRDADSAWIVADGDLRIHVLVARPLAAWLARLSQALAREHAFRPLHSLRGRIERLPAMLRITVEYPVREPIASLPVDPYGLEPFDARVKVTRAGKDTASVVLTLTPPINLATVVLLQCGGARYAACPDRTASPSWPGQRLFVVADNGMVLEEAHVLGQAVAAVERAGGYLETTGVVEGAVRYHGDLLPLVRTAQSAPS